MRIIKYSLINELATEIKIYTIFFLLALSYMMFKNAFISLALAYLILFIFTPEASVNFSMR